MMMLMNRSERIFDTLLDTKRKSVSIKTKFKLREYKLANGLTSLFLDVTGSHERERLNIEVAVDARYFDIKTTRCTSKAKNSVDINLILDKIEAKIAEIKIEYRLSDRVLTPSLFKSEYTGGLTRINFVAFFRIALDEDRVNYASEGTYNRYDAIYQKLKRFKENIMFSEIDARWILKYRSYLQNECKNGKTTENGNIIILKKFLRLASKRGVKLNIDLDDIVGGSTHGNRSYLNPKELYRLFDYYNSGFINESNKLVLGYFLFSCMTGLRISDVQKIQRQDLNNDDVSFINTKSNQDQFMILNLKAQEIVKNCELLFVKKFEDQTMNKELKKIMLLCGIKKKVSFHVARHTFATCFLRKEVGGDVVHLQALLKHKNITTTMIYSHIVQAEANEMVFYLDKLFK
jgi:integrase/recombinase XerD